MTISNIAEIAQNVYRISVYAPQIRLQFNHFLVRDEEPLLFHAGLRSMFPAVREAVAKIIDPSTTPVCGLVGVLVSVNDFAIRPARALTREDTLATGKYRFRFVPTPHVPHGWDAGVMLEETQGALFCSDLFHQWGECEPLSTNSIIERSRDALIETQAGPFANYVPYTHHTGRVLNELADRQPRMLATMHGSSYSGDCARALRELALVMREVLGPRASDGHTTSEGLVQT